ncbi:putative RNA methyltransferase [Sediminivirga luteola]|uniref:putative RNA methyltransferase n=1 Tax=Sediminivirga luteola TaxID=1774748 RepID=UPI001F562EA2|nr:methyltransferase domain-containing protein [Sediminivirga luteola]
MNRRLPDGVLEALRCPVCGGDLEARAGGVACAAGHSFDQARQGHLTLRFGRPAPLADTPAMIAAREEFLGAGHYEGITARLAALAGEAVTDTEAVLATATGATAGAAIAAEPGERRGLLLDLAGGTGHHLAGVLDALPEASGICLDLSVAALRRSARKHPRMAAIGADLRDRLPLGDACLDAVLSVFGPRNPAELARVLRPGGRLLVVTPTPAHLRELIVPLGMVSVDEAKESRLAAQLRGFPQVHREVLRLPLDLSRAEARALAAMGPSAFHTADAELDARAAALPDRVGVTAEVIVAAYACPAGRG